MTWTATVIACTPQESAALTTAGSFASTDRAATSGTGSGGAAAVRVGSMVGGAAGTARVAGEACGCAVLARGLGRYGCKKLGAEVASHSIPPSNPWSTYSADKGAAANPMASIHRDQATVVRPVRGALSSTGGGTGAAAMRPGSKDRIGALAFDQDPIWGVSTLGCVPYAAWGALTLGHEPLLNCGAVALGHEPFPSWGALALGHEPYPSSGRFGRGMERLVLAMGTA